MKTLQRQLDDGLPAPDATLTVRQLLSRWYSDVLRHQVATTALDNYRAIAENHIVPTIGRKRVINLTTADVDRLISEKLDNGLSVSTVRRIRSRDDFVVDHESRSVTCPAGHTVHLSKKGVAKFAPHRGICPLRSRCTKAAARSFTVSVHDKELVAARAAWRDDDLRAEYRTHTPIAERSIAWLVAKGNRRLRYRGVGRNEAWAHRRIAALNLRKLVVLGLTIDDSWKLVPT